MDTNEKLNGKFVIKKADKHRSKIIIYEINKKTKNEELVKSLKSQNEELVKFLKSQKKGKINTGWERINVRVFIMHLNVTNAKGSDTWQNSAGMPNCAAILGSQNISAVSAKTPSVAAMTNVMSNSG